MVRPTAQCAGRSGLALLTLLRPRAPLTGCRSPRPPRRVRLPQLRLELRRRRRRRRCRRRHRRRLRFVGLHPRASRNLLPLGWSGRAARRHRPPRLDAHRPPRRLRRGGRTVSTAATAPLRPVPGEHLAQEAGEALRPRPGEALLEKLLCAQGVPHPPVLQRRRAALRPDQLLPRRHRRVPRRRPRHADHALDGALGPGESDLQRRGRQGHRRRAGRG